MKLIYWVKWVKSIKLKTEIYEMIMECTEFEIQIIMDFTFTDDLKYISDDKSIGI